MDVKNIVEQFIIEKEMNKNNFDKTIKTALRLINAVDQIVSPMSALEENHSALGFSTLQSPF